VSRVKPYQIVLAVVLIIAAVFLIRVRLAAGEVSPAEVGHRLATAWCQECHAVEPAALNSGKKAPDFVAIANMPSSTELSLKVFLASSHPTMPNIILKPTDTEDLVAYILSLRRK
jgi:mono/diheme cytochrome c family protein